MASLEVEFCLKKKKLPRAQIFRQFFREWEQEKLRLLCFIVRTIEIFKYLWLVWFFILSIFGDRNICFQQVFLYPIENIDSLISNFKRFFYFILFFENCALWSFHSQCWKRSANCLCVANFFALQNCSNSNWDGKLIGRFNFVRLNFKHMMFDIV